MVLRPFTYSLQIVRRFALSRTRFNILSEVADLNRWLVHRTEDSKGRDAVPVFKSRSRLLEKEELVADYLTS
jgi:hypothetical protein